MHKRKCLQLRTEAQKRADKTFTVNAKIAEYEKIEKYCNDKSISKAQLLLKAAMYIIDNNIAV